MLAKLCISVTVFEVMWYLLNTVTFKLGSNVKAKHLARAIFWCIFVSQKYCYHDAIMMIIPDVCFVAIFSSTI